MTEEENNYPDEYRIPRCETCKQPLQFEVKHVGNFIDLLAGNGYWMRVCCTNVKCVLNGVHSEIQVKFIGP